jgi:hypothetical protein
MHKVLTFPIGFPIANCLNPPFRLNGLAYKVLQWYMCRMEGWFATDIDSISARCWTEVRGHFVMPFSMLSYFLKMYSGSGLTRMRKYRKSCLMGDMGLWCEGIPLL